MVKKRVQAVNRVTCNNLGCNNKFKQMVAWKSLCVHLYEVSTPLCETSLFTPYTRLGQPVDGTHAYRHD